MKYIVIGLGYFGSTLASNLTSMGHEVIGIDCHEERLEELKESITTVMKMDSTNINAVKTLPLHDIDAVIVGIGEDVGASILTLSILKNLNAKRIIGRAINQVHHNILTQIGIEEVVLPLEESAVHVSSMLQFKNVLKFNELTNDYAIAEAYNPLKYSGHLVGTINIRERFSIKLVAIKRAPKENSVSSIFRRNYKTELFPDDETILLDTDILVLAGRISDIKRFLES
jgi:trk system potassium uptake protein